MGVIVVRVSGILDVLVNEATVCTTESQDLVVDRFEFNISNIYVDLSTIKAKPSKPRNNLFIKLYF